MMVQQLLSNTSAVYPESVAIVHDKMKLTFGDLQKQSDALAAYIQRHWKISRGDHISILYENCPEYVISYFAILKTGATVVSVNSAETPEKVKESIAHADAVGLIGSTILWNKMINKSGIPETIRQALDYRDKSLLMMDGEVRVGGSINFTEEAPEDPHGIDLDLAEIVYTSGSTSKPKGVMLSHRNLATNMLSIQDYFKLQSDDSVVVILPLSYIYGKSLLLTHIQIGGKVIIDNRFTYPALVLETIAKEKATGFAGVPSTFSILTTKTSIAEIELPYLRYVAQAGGAMAPALQEDVIEAILPAKLFVMYGATEAAPRLTWLPPERLKDKMGSIGIPLLNVEMIIRGVAGEELGPNEEGELSARGSNIMLGYWKDPENTERVLQGGYYLTGDIGYRDKEGFYFITGRKGDFVKIKGFRISCKEVEECILELNEVHEIAVIPAPDAVFGEVIRAYAVPSEIESEDFIKRAAAHIARRIGANRVPAQWDFRDNLPKNSSGKIMKERLKKELKNDRRI